MLTNDCERDIQLELNRNYLKSFPARLKFCHIVSTSEWSHELGISEYDKNWFAVCLLLSSQFLCSLASGLLLYYTPDHIWLTFIPICIESILALCSLIFLVSSTINWRTTGKIRMARINFVSHSHEISLSHRLFHENRCFF